MITIDSLTMSFLQFYVLSSAAVLARNSGINNFQLFTDIETDPQLLLTLRALGPRSFVA
jgi:hypothetical protein